MLLFLFAWFLWACEDIGYIIPIPVVKHFLEDVEKNKGGCSGFCDIGIQIQLMESENIRQAMGMDPSQTGILVNRVSLYKLYVFPWSSAYAYNLGVPPLQRR